MHLPKNKIFHQHLSLVHTRRPRSQIGTGTGLGTDILSVKDNKWFDFSKAFSWHNIVKSKAIYLLQKNMMIAKYF